MTNKMEFAEIVVPMYRCSTDVKTYQSRASIGPRTDVPILVANKKKKEIINIYIRGESARAGGRVCAYNNTTKQQKQIYFNDAKNRKKETSIRTREATSSGATRVNLWPR